MRNSLVMASILLLVLGMCACSIREKKTATKSPEAERLLKRMTDLADKGFMFGHQDDPVYGIRWEGDENRSDVKSVCGDYPAVMAFDLGRIERGGKNNLDNVSFERIRKEIIAHYNRGGICSLSWHADNPVTGKASWDVSDSTVVSTILAGGVNHEKFLGWLDKVADFMNSLVTQDRTKVPIIFRPWHEHTGSWFWWGQNLCSSEQYKALWKMTYGYLQGKGINHLLYAYSSGSEPENLEEYLERYPGDTIIDLLGFDTYQFDRDKYVSTMEKSLAILTEAGRKHNKLIAVTETGFEAIPDSMWWTETLFPIVKKYSVSYVLVWRNAREKDSHYYAPYPGQVSENDFKKFHQYAGTLFLSDLKINKK